MAVSGVRDRNAQGQESESYRRERRRPWVLCCREEKVMPSRAEVCVRGVSIGERWEARNEWTEPERLNAELGLDKFSGTLPRLRVTTDFRAD